MLSPAPSRQADRPSLTIEPKRSAGSIGRSVRESSREPASDPILARYLAIKRELDLKGPPPLQQTSRRNAATPSERRGGSGLDARSILQSPPPAATAATRPGYAARHDSPQPTHHQFATHRPANSPTSLRQSANASAAHEKEQQLNQLSQVVAEALSSKRSLEEALDERGKEIQRLGAIISELRDVRRVQPFASSEGEHLLQGRLAALEALVQTKDATLDQERSKLSQLDQRVSDLATRNEELQGALNVKDRLAGEQQVNATAEKYELQKLRQNLDDANERERATRSELMRVEALSSQRLSELERLQHERKEEARQHAATIRNLELQLATNAERIRDLDASRSHNDDDKRLMEAELQRLNDQLRSATTKLETTKVLSAQESIVSDELKYEVGRYKKIVAELRDEILAQEEAREETDLVILELEKDKKARQVLEGQCRSAQAKIHELELTIDGLRSSLDEGKRRLAAAHEECSAIPSLEQQLGELRSLLQGKALTVERMSVTERDNLSTIERLKTEVDAARERESSMVQEAVEQASTISRLERRVDDLNAEIKQRNSLVDDLRGLRRAVDERDQEVSRLQGDVASWQDKCRDLNDDVETLLSIKKQFDELVLERQELFRVVDEKEAEIVELHREAAVSHANLRHKEDELRQSQDLVESLEGQVQRQNQLLSDRSALESKCRQLTHELSANAHEALRERDRTADALSRIAAKDEALDAERARRAELEQRSSELLQEVGRVQLEQGKCAVMLEASERELVRVSKDLELRLQQADQLSAELTVCRRQIQGKDSDMQSALVKERIAEERSSQLATQLSGYQEEVSRLRGIVEQQDAKLLALDGVSGALADSAHRESTLKAKIDELDKNSKRCESETSELSALLSQLRDKNRELAADAQLSVKLKSQLVEAKAGAEKLQQLLDGCEKEDAAKAKLLLEKERESSRLREKVSAQSSDLEAERARKKSLEHRIKELEAECARASTLDGQVAGLNMIIAQRTADLEEERNANADLRARLRGNDRSASQRALQATADLEAKLTAKEDAIVLLETEIKKRQAGMEQMRRELEAVDDARRGAEASLREKKAQLDSVESSWSTKYGQLERLYEGAKATSRDVDEVSRLLDDLSEQKRKCSMLSTELQAKSRELASYKNGQSDDGRTHVASSSAPVSRQGSLELTAAEAEIRIWREKRLARSNNTSSGAEAQQASASPRRAVSQSSASYSPSRRGGASK